MSLSDFKNEPILELRRASERARLSEALTQLESQLPITVPVIIGAAVDLRLERHRPGGRRGHRGPAQLA
jgi:hypothetical protein